MKTRILILLSLLFSQPAWAVLDVHVYGGVKSGEFDDGVAAKDIDGTLIGFSVHVSPIPMVPIAFGMATEMTTFEKFSVYTDSTGYAVTPELYVWLPIDFVGVKPFGKVGYSFGAITAEGGTGGDKYKGAFSTKGTHLIAGIKWEPPMVPFFALLAEYDFGYEKSEVLSFDLNGDKVKLVDEEDQDWKNDTWRLGIEVKI